MIRERITLTQFIIEDQRSAKGATGDFSVLLSDVVTACKTISHLVSSGGVDADAIDPRAYLEHAASDSMIQSTICTGRLAGMSSKCVAGLTPIPARDARGKYLLAFHPLNGSGNLDIHGMADLWLIATQGMGFYNTSKHALVGMARTLLLELYGTGVRCALVCPGVANTGFQRRADATMYARSTRLVTCTSAQVADATVRAIQRRTHGEVIVPRRARVLTTLSLPVPGLSRLVLRLLG